MASLETTLQLLSPYPPGWGGTLLKGAASTLAISVSAYLIGLAIGMAGALGKLSGNRPLGLLLNLYTTAIRAVPELILIVGLYYAGTDGLNRLLLLAGMPPLEVNGFVAAVAVLGFVQGAYMTEVLRGAILAIPSGQIEAARAFGMSPALRFRRVVFLSAFAQRLTGAWQSLACGDQGQRPGGGRRLSGTGARDAAGRGQHQAIFPVLPCRRPALPRHYARFEPRFSLIERRVRRGQPVLA